MCRQRAPIHKGVDAPAMPAQRTPFPDEGIGDLPRSWPAQGVGTRLLNLMAGAQLVRLETEMDLANRLTPLPPPP